MSRSVFLIAISHYCCQITHICGRLRTYFPINREIIVSIYVDIENDSFMTLPKRGSSNLVKINYQGVQGILLSGRIVPEINLIEATYFYIFQKLFRE